MMFAFGKLDGPDYAAAAARRNLLLVAVTLAFPFVLREYINVSGCRGIGGACGALALVVSLFAKPAIYVLFALSYASITERRLADAALPRAFALGFVVLMLANVHWGMVMGAPWTVGFATGFGGGEPTYLMAALAFAAALSVLRTSSELPQSEAGPIRRELSAQSWALISLVLVAAFGALIALGTMMRGDYGGWLRATERGFLAPLFLPANVAAVAAPAILGAFCYREWCREGQFGRNSLWMLPVATCAAIIVAASAVAAMTAAWIRLAYFVGLGGLSFHRQLVHVSMWLSRAEFLALLIMPWLLSKLPRTPSNLPSATPLVPRSPLRGAIRETSTVRGGRATFGRRGVPT